MKQRHIAAALLVFATATPAFAGGSMHGSVSSSSSSPLHDSQTVSQVQQELNLQGHSLVVDGIHGPKTKSALKEYQRKQGLQASGSVNHQTLASLGIDASVGGSGSFGSSPSQDSIDTRASSSGEISASPNMSGGGSY